MSHAIARLHGIDERRVVGVDRLGPRWRALAVDADLHDEHLVALVVWACAGGVLAVVVGVVLGVWIGAFALATIAAVPAVLLARRRGRRSVRLIDALPLVVDMIVRSLRSGASLAQALGEVAAEAPTAASGELQRVHNEIRLGRTPATALRAWAERDRSVEVRIVAATLAMASENESGTGHALAGVADSLRDRAALVADIRTHAAQAVASMYAMVFLPVAFLLVDLLGSKRASAFLVGSRLGRVCLGSALVLDAAGWLWMRSLIRRRMPT